MQGGYQIQTPPMTKVNKFLLIAMAACFVINFVCSKTLGLSLTPFLGLSGSGVSGGMIYQFFTYPFIASNFLEVLFSGLLLWFIGSELEQTWGSERYGFLLACSVLIGGLFYCLISLIFFQGSPFFQYPLWGMSGVSSGLCVVYGRLYPEREFSFMMLIPVKAKYFTWILVGMVLFSGLSSPSGIGAWGQLGTMGGAFLMSFFIYHPALNPLLSVFKKSSGTRVNSVLRKKKPKASHLSLVGDEEHRADGEEKPPKYWQ
jgi:membrane associated rhomboid family serine protease